MAKRAALCAASMVLLIPGALPAPAGNFEAFVPIGPEVEERSATKARLRAGVGYRLDASFRVDLLYMLNRVRNTRRIILPLKSRCGTRGWTPAEGHAFGKEKSR
jgi:hypothetical protein